MKNHVPFSFTRKSTLLLFYFFLFLIPDLVFAQPLESPGDGAVWKDIVSNSSLNFQPRHEAGYVGINGKFYMVGGRGNRALNVFDPLTQEWTEASIPFNKELHHFQAINFQNKLYLIGAFTGSFPDETPIGDIYIYDPSTNEWEVRTDVIPVARRRGAAGAVVYNNQIYIIGGIINGHTNGWVKWFDKYDPATGKWQILPDAPRERDHFQAVIVTNKLYAIAGRKTGFTSLLGDTETAVDVYNFSTGNWTTLPPQIHLPTARAGAATFEIDGKIIIAGGESESNGAHNDVDIFDPSVNTWSALPPLNNGRHGIQAIADNGIIYIAGGWGYVGASGEELITQESLSYSATVPQIRPVLLKLLPDVLLSTDSVPLQIDLSNYFKMPDGSTLNYTFFYDSSNTIIKSAEIEKDLLQLELNNGKSGSAVIKLRATNNASLFIEDKFTLTIKPAYLSAPVITAPIPDQKIAFNSRQVKVFVGKVFNDDKGVGNLLFSIPNITNKNIISSAEIIGDTLFVAFNPNATGRTAIYVKATDKDNLSVTDAFLLELVSKTVLLPTVRSPLNDLQLFKNSLPRVIDLSAVFSHANGAEKLKLSIKNSNPKILKAVISGDSLSLRLMPDSTGKAELIIKATDAAGNFAEDKFNVIIIETGGSPVFELRINSGGGSLIFKGDQWIADTFYQAGKVYNAPGNITGTDNQEIYKSERHGDFSYAIPVATGKYNVRLHFSEIYFDSPGKRIFNIDIENRSKIIDSLDIVSITGGNSIAYSTELDSINVDDGFLNLNFISIENYAKISGIEIFSVARQNINLPPYVSFAIPDQEMKYEDNIKVVNVYKVFSDDMGSVPLKLTVEEITDSSKLTEAIISGLTISLKKAALQSGTTAIKIRATDNSGAYAEEEFLLTIKEPAPSKPIVLRPLSDINEKMNAVIPPINISKTFFDNRGNDRLEYSLQVIGNNLFSKIGISDGLLSVNLNKNVFGSAIIKVKAIDKDGLFAEDEFNINIISTDSSVVKSIAINAGGESIVSEFTQWQSDTGYIGGNSFTYLDYLPSAGDSVLRTERFGNFSYKIPVTNGTYKVRLHFVELFWRKAGERVFNVDIENGQGLLKAYDILVKTGAPSIRVVEETDSVIVTDGFMDINFVTVVDNAKISGIEIIQQTSTVSATAQRKMISEGNLRDMNFKIYPNPLAGNTVYIDIPQNFAGPNTNISFVNMQGELVFKFTGVKNSTRSIPVQLPASLAKGTYLVLLNNDGQTKISKLIIQ